MSQCYMNFDRLNEKINLDKALNEASYKRAVQVMSGEQMRSKGGSKGVLYERVNGVLRKR